MADNNVEMPTGLFGCGRNKKTQKQNLLTHQMQSVARVVFQEEIQQTVEEKIKEENEMKEQVAKKTKQECNEHWSLFLKLQTEKFESKIETLKDTLWSTQNDLKICEEKLAEMIITAENLQQELKNSQNKIQHLEEEKIMKREPIWVDVKNNVSFKGEPVNWDNWVDFQLINKGSFPPTSGPVAAVLMKMPCFVKHSEGQRSVKQVKGSGINTEYSLTVELRQGSSLQDLLHIAVPPRLRDADFSQLEVSIKSLETTMDEEKPPPTPIVAFIHCNGNLLELDGRRLFPVTRGKTTPAGLLKDVAKFCLENVAGDPNAYMFKVLSFSASAQQ